MSVCPSTGIDDKALRDKREETPKQTLKLSKKQKKLKKRQANTLTQAAKRKKQEDVLIIDCAKKRGVNKVRKSKEEEVEESPVESRVRCFFPLTSIMLVWIVKLSYCSALWLIVCQIVLMLCIPL